MKKLILKGINSHRWRVLAVCVLAMLCLTILSRSQVYASNVYAAPDCSTDNGLPLTAPYTKDGVTYNCVNNVKQGETVPAPNCGPCLCYDTGVAGKVCLVPANITFGAASNSTTSKDFSAQNCKNGTTNDGGVCKIQGTCTDAGALTSSNCTIVGWLVTAVNVLSAAVGIVVIIMIIVAGIQYSAAGDDPQKVAQARSRIVNAIIALVVFIFMFAFLQWVIPGGIL